MRKIKCQYCGAVFETNDRNIKYCSRECREAGAAARQKEWKEKHPSYNSDYYKAHKRAKIAQNLTP